MKSRVGVKPAKHRFRIDEERSTSRFGEHLPLGFARRRLAGRADDRPVRPVQGDRDYDGFAQQLVELPLQGRGFPNLRIGSFRAQFEPSKLPRHRTLSRSTHIILLMF